MTETEKMFFGKMYNPFAEGMPEARRHAHELCQKYNAIPESEAEKREEILSLLMPDHAEGVYLQGPVYFDFGTHISMGKNSYANFNFCVLDENRVTIDFHKIWRCVMAYITRELERKFLKLNDFFKVILVTGARQVGKTTMLKHLAESDRTYVTMDNTMARELAQSDPVLFFQTYKPPVLIDEVQKAPELFEQIKIICDESDEKGLIWLTGSQQYNMMKRVRETLAGRIGILELYSLSAREKAGLVFDTDLDFSLATLQARQRKLPKNDVVQVFNHIWEGGMPQVQGVDDELRQEYFNSYVDTYLMRDATEAGGITDTVRFRKFLVGCASLVSEQVNYSTLAESADIAPSTAKEFL